jgi:hypothetical protein
MIVPVQLVTEAVLPLKMTALVPWVAPKFDPAMVNDVPTSPDVGLKLVMAGGGVTVKAVLLLAMPPTVTITFPAVAPTGTWAVILTELQAVGAIDPADVPLKETVLVPWDEPKFAPEIKTKAPTAPDDGLRLVIPGGGGITVKFTPLLPTPVTDTTTFPVVAPAGTVTWILVSLQLVGAAIVPLKASLLFPWLAPKFVPVIVTSAPTAADVGLTLEMFGGGITVKFTPLLATLPTVTTTGPVVAPLGTKDEMLVAVQLNAADATPLKETPGAPWTDKKFAPVIVTELLTNPEAGFKLVMIGDGGGTVNATPLLESPPTDTTTLPDTVPAGTGTTMLVALQFVGVASVPLKLTVLVPCIAPKPVPVIVTGVPTAPDEGFRPVTVIGDGVTVNRTPLLEPAEPAPTLTTTLPVEAPNGTGTIMLVALQLVGTPGRPPKVTWLVPWVAPKVVPVIVTKFPTVPVVGLKDIMLGTTIKNPVVLLAIPPTVTPTNPVVALAGTGATMLVVLQLVGVAGVPLKVTVLVPCVGPNPSPVMVTDVPTGPEVGPVLEMLGITANGAPLLAAPPTVTTTFPVLEPDGTAATMLVVLQLVGVAVMPLNVTVLFPCNGPKFVPEIVTDLPTIADVGLRLVMVGIAWVTVIVADADFVGSATEVAVSVTVGGAGTTAGAMYVPIPGPAVAPNVPQAAPEQPAPESDHVTLAFWTSFWTVELKPEVDPVATVAVGGATVTEIGRTVKTTPLLARPPTVTTMLPVVAPTGTGARMIVWVQNVGVARIPLNETVLAPGETPKPAPTIPTDVPTAPDAGLRLVTIGVLVTVKVTPLLFNPPTVTTTFPVEAPGGTESEMFVGVQEIPWVAATPLKVTVPKVDPKFAPVIVTGIPIGPKTGLKPVITGGTKTVKLTALLDWPPTVTTTLPVVAPVGTGTVMLVALQSVGVAATPLNVTVLAPWDVPKFAPAIVTNVPAGPDVGLRLFMLGAGIVTVKLRPLLGTPPTMTTTLPVVAPDGTGTVTLVVLQFVGVAAAPLNVTVLVPCEAPKFAPAIVTGVPTGPDAGLNEVILGGRVPAAAALKAASKAPPFSEMESVALTETAPAVAWTASSAIIFVLGAAGTRSSTVYPLPAVKVTPEAVANSPNTRSPPTVVVAVPLFSVDPEPWAAETTSMELDVANPAYSRMAKRRVLLARDSETVTVLAPPEIFSA